LAWCWTDGTTHRLASVARFVERLEKSDRIVMIGTPLYRTTTFDLILNLYQIPPHHSVVAGLRESLRGPEMR